MSACTPIYTTADRLGRSNPWHFESFCRILVSALYIFFSFLFFSFFFSAVAIHLNCGASLHVLVDFCSVWRWAVHSVSLSLAPRSPPLLLLCFSSPFPLLFLSLFLFFSVLNSLFSTCLLFQFLYIFYSLIFSFSHSAVVINQSLNRYWYPLIVLCSACPISSSLSLSLSLSSSLYRTTSPSIIPPCEYSTLPISLYHFHTTPGFSSWLPVRPPNHWRSASALPWVSSTWLTRPIANRGLCTVCSDRWWCCWQG